MKIGLVILLCLFNIWSASGQLYHFNPYKETYALWSNILHDNSQKTIQSDKVHELTVLTEYKTQKHNNSVLKSDTDCVIEFNKSGLPTHYQKKLVFNSYAMSYDILFSYKYGRASEINSKIFVSNDPSKLTENQISFFYDSIGRLKRQVQITRTIYKPEYLNQHKYIVNDSEIKTYKIVYESGLKVCRITEKTIGISYAHLNNLPGASCFDSLFTPLDPYLPGYKITKADSAGRVLEEINLHGFTDSRPQDTISLHRYTYCQHDYVIHSTMTDNAGTILTKTDYVYLLNGLRDCNKYQNGTITSYIYKYYED